MIRNFLKTTFRNFLKNKSYVFINVIGLGLSLACCIVGYLNLKFTSDFDQNHLNHERIYKIHVNKSVQNNPVPFGITPLPLGAQIKDQLASRRRDKIGQEKGIEGEMIGVPRLM